MLSHHRIYSCDPLFVCLSGLNWSYHGVSGKHPWPRIPFNADPSFLSQSSSIVLWHVFPGIVPGRLLLCMFSLLCDDGNNTRSWTLKATNTWDRDTAPETTTKTRRFKAESRPDGQHSPCTVTSSRVTLEPAWRDKSTTHAVSYGAETWALTSQAKNTLAAAQTKMERSMLNIACRDRKTNTWVREKTKVTLVIEQIRRPKCTWAVHVSRIRVGQCVSPPGNPAKGTDLEEEDRRHGGETNKTTTGRVPSGRG